MIYDEVHHDYNSTSFSNQLQCTSKLTVFTLQLTNNRNWYCIVFIVTKHDITAALCKKENALQLKVLCKRLTILQSNAIL